MSSRSKQEQGAKAAVGEAEFGAETGVKSALRVLKVLEYFDLRQSGARAIEIIDHLGFPQSSTSVLLRSLLKAGYLEYLPSTHSYIPTPRTALLGSWIGGSPIRRGSIGRMMEELSAKTGEAIVLARSEDLYSRYIDVIEATNLLRMHVAVGRQRLLASSTMGVALISHLSDSEIGRLVKRTNAEALPRHKPIDVKLTLAHVEQFRNRGYFFSRGFMTPQAGMICMRLPADLTSSDQPLAIGIGGLAETIERSEAKLASLLSKAIARCVKKQAQQD